MDFIEDDEAVFIATQEQRRVAELLAVLARLQVEVERFGALGDRGRDRRLADLPRAEEAYGGLSIQAVLNRSEGTPGYHPCILNT